MTSQDLDKNLQEIKKYLEDEISGGDIIEIQEKLLKLSSLIGLSAECIKVCKEQYLYKQGAIIKQGISLGLSPAILKLNIESDLWEEGARLTYAERLNAGIVHCCDALRTIISLYKSEKENSKFQI